MGLFVICESCFPVPLLFAGALPVLCFGPDSAGRLSRRRPIPIPIPILYPTFPDDVVMRRAVKFTRRTQTRTQTSRQSSFKLLAHMNSEISPCFRRLVSDAIMPFCRKRPSPRLLHAYRHVTREHSAITTSRLAPVLVGRLHTALTCMHTLRFSTLSLFYFISSLARLSILRPHAGRVEIHLWLLHYVHRFTGGDSRDSRLLAYLMNTNLSARL